ncbi:MAG TPA: pyridoxamine 5'-phosphate oxidase family protein, partial [Blastocatellia bacterium]|nr:pyridoxamine 5'-phosphate oxidase family protein [Blastocatellia bacterium]
LRAFTEHVIPGRWDDVREPNEQELKGTTVLALPLLEVSAKIRTGPPKDDEEDMAIPVWAGELPLRITAGSPVDDPQLSAGIIPPAYVKLYSRQARTTNGINQEKSSTPS